MKSNANTPRVSGGTCAACRGPLVVTKSEYDEKRHVLIVEAHCACGPGGGEIPDPRYHGAALPRLWGAAKR